MTKVNGLLLGRVSAVLSLWLVVLPAFGVQTLEFHLKKGDEYFEHYDNAMALVHYERAYELAPDRFDPLFKLIRAINDVAEDVRDRQGDKKQVEAFFRRSLDLAKELYEKYPTRPESPFVLAVAYGNLALFIAVKERVQLASKVEALLKKSIALDPSYPYHYLGLGVFYKEVAGITWIERFFGEMFFGKIPDASYADAELFIKKSLERDPTFLYSIYQLAETYKEWGQYEKAYQNYKKLVGLPQRDHSDPILKEHSKQTIDELTTRFPSKFKHLERPEIVVLPSKKPVSGIWSSSQSKAQN